MAAINAYVSDETKDVTYNYAKQQGRSVSWVVEQALMWYRALQPLPPIIGTISADMTAEDWAVIGQRIKALKEQGE